MKQKLNESVKQNVSYLLFADFYDYISESSFEKEDENKVIHYGYHLMRYYKATEIEQLIRNVWGDEYQNLLTGVIVYAYKFDSYFNPKFNSIKEFFLKIYYNRKILIKIGSGEENKVFPFVKLLSKKNKRKILLIRC